jgi:hypothetical protein
MNDDRKRLLSVEVKWDAGHRGKQTPRTSSLEDRRVTGAEVIDGLLAPGCCRHSNVVARSGHEFRPAMTLTAASRRRYDPRPRASVAGRGGAHAPATDALARLASTNCGATPVGACSVRSARAQVAVDVAEAHAHLLKEDLVAAS